MEAILQGLPGVQVYLDNMVVADKENNCDKLREVFRRFCEHCVGLHPSKCKVRQREVEYLGHRKCVDDPLPKTENTEAVLTMPRPTSVSELRSFIGFVTYYTRFWQFGHGARTTLRAAKEKPAGSGGAKLESFDVLDKRHQIFNSIRSGKAHHLGNVCVIVQHQRCFILRRKRRLEASRFPTRTLTAVERNYAQIEREALAVVFGVTKFHEYLLGNTFTLITHHKTLL